MDSTISLSSIMGNAVTVALLLSDWERYCLSERVAYHFHLTEAILPHDGAVKRRSEQEERDEDTLVCGVSSLLECVPTQQWHRLTRREKRALKNEIRQFNVQAEAARQKQIYCHEPSTLPLKLNPGSRVYFAYEMTRIAFCLDASPTLTSTFGSSGDGEGCCPMDRLANMARTFFTSLVEPIPVPSTTNKGVWRPQLAVTVLAVYPRQGGGKMTGLLVRDFRVTDADSAELLASKIEEWALGEVEAEIARRLSRRSGLVGFHKTYDAWTVPMHSSSLRDLLDAGDVALSTLSSWARPCIVLATDGRSVSCDGIIDITSDSDRIDIPVVVLDLSSPSSHGTGYPPSQEDGDGQFHLLNYDPCGAMFPLHLADDTEALYGICKATEGCFFDSKLLKEAASANAGHVYPDSPLATDHFFSFKRHTILPNGVQWYVLFSLSPLSPTFHSGWGRLAPPDYIQRKLSAVSRIDPPMKERNGRRSSGQPAGAQVPAEKQAPAVLLHASSKEYSRAQSSESMLSQRKPQVKSTFSTYVINPIRIQGLLLMRVREGYRAKQYGQSTHDPDKVFIQFTLPLELGTVIHYELSYKALPGHNHMVGFANIKIELSGEAGFIQAVKNDFLHQGQRSRPLTMAQQVSARLCKLLRWIRKEDMLQSYLSPVKWSDQLSQPSTPFVRRLGTMTLVQRHRHLRFDRFDCVCVGRMPYIHETDFLSEFTSVDNGEQELVEAIANWSTQTIEDRKCYVKRTGSESDDLASYCVVEICCSATASRVFTISVEAFGGFGGSDRLSLLASLKELLGDLKDVEVLPKQMGQYLVGVQTKNFDETLRRKQEVLESQHNHASWDLVKDPELLPLLMKRRTEIGEFLLLESSDDRALFAKIVPEDNARNKIGDPGDLVQYQLAILSDKVVVDLYMESEGGVFFPFRETENSRGKRGTKFHSMVRILRRRDQECGRALRSRTTLLRIFERDDGGEISSKEDHLSCVERLLEYSSRDSIRLRFFHSGSGAANNILRSLTEDMLLSQSFGAKVTKLSIDPSIDIHNLGPGDWFLVVYDKDTMSIAHLSWSEKSEVSEEDGRGFAYRKMTFFTIGISDLYSRRDDVADDDSEDDHISEHICVTEFTDLIEAAHKENYASAAYIALRDDSRPLFQYFHLDDFAEVISQLEFVEVTAVLVSGENRACATGTSKLSQLIETVLWPIKDEYFCLYYNGSGRSELLYHLSDDESDSFSEFQRTDDGSAIEEETVEDTQNSPGPGYIPVEGEESSLSLTSVSGTPDRHTASPPLFVRFLLDGEPAQFHELNEIEGSANLTLLLSIFSENKGRNQREPSKIDPARLPASHLNVAVELAALLNAYVAEQSLELSRHLGASIGDEELRVANTCLRKARDVVASAIDVYFYMAKTDSMVPASAPAGGSSVVEEGFAMVELELTRNKDIYLKNYGPGKFVVIETKEDGSGAFSYWCFVNIRKSRGLISVEVYHPEGLEQASVVMTKMHNLICTSCHRVNQILLLRRLHQSKNASSLLVPPDSETVPGEVFEASTPFQPGLFSCPVVFRTSFDLFYRCATNPSQVARTLEATVLHIFAVSNRRHLFVYKDENEATFYMTLNAKGGGVEADGTIELLVYGVEEPDSSVTTQLTGLLQKRLLLIAVDMLSSLLAKNPSYLWRQPDLQFVGTYEEEWGKLEDSYSCDALSREHLYAFPEHVNDPGMILCFLRQNLCGSTFFHLLSTQESVANDSGHNYFDGKSPIGYTFCYNNAPTNLDPKFQAQSTLTTKGAKLSRTAGTGIAIIEVSLLDCNGKPPKSLQVAVPTEDAHSILEIPLDFQRFRQVGKLGLEQSMAQEGSSPYLVRVKITDTALKREVLHEWILLTLNQVLVAWEIERHLEREQRGMLRPRIKPEKPRSSFASELARKEAIEDIYPGLPAFCSFLESSYDLPHPAISRIEHIGIVRSSAVASVAFELLERTLLDQFRSETKGKVSLTTEDLCLIRLSRAERPQRVHLSWDTGQKRAVVREHEDSGRGRIIQDAPIDCPEYMCFYRSPEWRANTSDEVESFPPKLFEEVSVEDGTGESSNPLPYLASLKKQNRIAFRRSFAFVFTLKRNRRTLFAYNWSPQLLKKTASRLQERDASFLVSTGQSVDSLQRRSLKDLSPRSSAQSSHKARQAPHRVLKHEPGTTTETSDSPPTMEDERNVRTRPSRRLIRPVAIRRPKLIGKSVEGAAMHAVAASRARASSNLFKGNPISASAASTASKAQKDDSKGTLISAQSRSSTERPRSFRGSNKSNISEREEVKDLVRVKRDYDTFNVAGENFLRRHTRQALTMRSLTSSLWPVKAGKSIPLSVTEFLLSRASPAWSDASELLPLHPSILKTFPFSFGQTLSTWIPGLSLVPVVLPTTDPASTTNPPVVLMSEVKNVRSCKCFAVIKLDTTTTQVEGQTRRLVCCDGFVLTLPRRPKTDGDNSGNDDIYVSRALSEKDSTGLDKLATDLRTAIPLESILFDYVAVIAERTMKSTGGELNYSEALHLTQQLVSRYDLRHQKKMLRSNYKAFQATIVLRSYRNRLIDMFDSNTLFRWLMSNAEKRTLIACGARGLCFKREVVVRGTHSICFLTCDRSAKEKMELVILCRTQGRSLEEFMFREGSYVAITILDNIAVEAAGLAYEELRSAASCLHRDTLWRQVSMTGPRSGSRTLPSKAIIRELLELCTIRPLSQYSKSNIESQRLSIILENQLDADWWSCCERMSKDPAFSPSWSIVDDEVEGDYKRLFYLSSEELFLLITVDSDGHDFKIEVVEGKDRSLADRKKGMVVQKLTNFLLHYVWSDML